MGTSTTTTTVSSISKVLNHTLACTVQNRGDLNCNHGVMEG